MKYFLSKTGVKTEGENYFIAPNSSVIGNVTLGKDSSVWFGCTIRGDNEPIMIGEGSNIQDNSVLHTDIGFPINIHKSVSVGHMVMLHGCTIEEETLIGIGSIILNGAKIGKNCLIGANTLITEGKEIPDRSVVMGSPGKIVRQATQKDIETALSPALHYASRYKEYKIGLQKQL
mgnify:CR=1 FL=1